jgi:hypothetical protein
MFFKWFDFISLIDYNNIFGKFIFYIIFRSIVVNLAGASRFTGEFNN